MPPPLYKPARFYAVYINRNFFLNSVSAVDFYTELWNTTDVVTHRQIRCPIDNSERIICVLQQNGMHTAFFCVSQSDYIDCRPAGAMMFSTYRSVRSSASPFTDALAILHWLRWRHNWKSAQVVNSHLVCDPTIRQPGFDLPRQQWSLHAEPFSHGTGTLRCLQKEMATYRHWSVSLCRDPDDVSYCWILSPDKTEWRLISATLCGW